MTTLTDFLLARLAEDEALYAHYDMEEPFRARVLAECASKRAIVDAHRTQVEDDDSHAWIVASEVLLRALALPYADHPDYRQEWKP